MIEVSNLELNYGKAQILKNVSFHIPRGAMMGLIGPNGAGKSSLIKVLAGLVHPVGGTLKLNKTPMAFKNLRSITGYTIDSPSFYLHLSAHENLKLLAQISNSTKDLNELLDLVGLGLAGKKKVKAYSTGMKQRLAIAASLISSPELLILDEPFNGLDPGGYRDLWDILLDLNEQGTTIIISSHLLADLEEYATHFMLIHKGEIAMTVSRSELVSSKRIVSFDFKRPLSSEELLLFKEYEIQLTRKNLIQILMPSEAIAQVTKQLVEADIPPINIKTQTILQQSYFKISR